MADKSIAEKIMAREPITRKEFQSLVSKTDWTDYAKRVAERMAPIVDAHERARARSYATAQYHVFV